MHKKEYPKVEDVIEAIHQDQGVAILAHPRLSRVEALISHFIRLGVDGIETWHSSQSEDAIRYSHCFALANQLLEVGGSDCHGKYGKEPEIGNSNPLMWEGDVEACIMKFMNRQEKLVKECGNILKTKTYTHLDYKTGKQDLVSDMDTYIEMY